MLTLYPVNSALDKAVPRSDHAPPNAERPRLAGIFRVRRPVLHLRVLPVASPVSSVPPLLLNPPALAPGSRPDLPVVRPRILNALVLDALGTSTSNRL